MRDQDRQPQLSIEDHERPPAYDDGLTAPVVDEEARGVAVIWPPPDEP